MGEKAVSCGKRVDFGAAWVKGSSRGKGFALNRCELRICGNEKIERVKKFREAFTYTAKIEDPKGEKRGGLGKGSKKRERGWGNKSCAGKMKGTDPKRAKAFTLKQKRDRQTTNRGKGKKGGGLDEKTPIQLLVQNQKEEKKKTISPEPGETDLREI